MSSPTSPINSRRALFPTTDNHSSNSPIKRKRESSPLEENKENRSPNAPKVIRPCIKQRNPEITQEQIQQHLIQNIHLFAISCFALQNKNSEKTPTYKYFTEITQKTFENIHENILKNGIDATKKNIFFNLGFSLENIKELQKNYKNKSASCKTLIDIYRKSPNSPFYLLGFIPFPNSIDLPQIDKSLFTCNSRLNLKIEMKVNKLYSSIMLNRISPKEATTLYIKYTKEGLSELKQSLTNKIIKSNNPARLNKILKYINWKINEISKWESAGTLPINFKELKKQYEECIGTENYTPFIKKPSRVRKKLKNFCEGETFSPRTNPWSKMSSMEEGATGTDVVEDDILRDFFG